MPPKVQHTKEKIINAALDVIRESGVENLNARTVAKKIGCSTQPIMYHFKTIEELKQAVYQAADQYHTEYMMEFHGDNPLLDIGLNYIRFAVEERFLFQFLFQSNSFSGKSLSELIDGEELAPLLNILMQEANIDVSTAKYIFRSICMVAHGYAAMFANNMMDISEDTIKSDLYMIYIGALEASKKAKCNAEMEIVMRKEQRGNGD